MGKIVKKVAIGVGIGIAAVATAGAAIPALGIGAALGGLSATVLGGIAAASLVGVQYLMKSSNSAQGLGNNQFTAQNVGPPPTPIKRTIRQPDAPRCFIFGRVKTSGVYFFYETDQAKNLYMGIYLCDGPVSAFSGIYCDDEGFTAATTGTTLPDGSANSYKTLDGNSNLFIPADGIKWIKNPYANNPVYSTYDCSGIAYEPINGTIAGSASYIFNTLMPTSNYSANLNPSGAFTSNLGSVWSASHLAKGVTCLYTFNSTFTYGNANRIKYFPNGWPEWSVLLLGAGMYNPSIPSHTERVSIGTGSISGTTLTLSSTTSYSPQIGDIIYGTGVKSGTTVTAISSSTSFTVNISQTVSSTALTIWTLYNATWGYSENPALIAAHFVSWLISRNATAILGINWTSIATAAALCDQQVSVNRAYFGNGTTYESFALISGVYYFNTPPREFLANIMAACDGSYGVDNNGLFTMWIGSNETPTVTFTENDIGSFTEDFVEAASEAVNEIHINYTEPRQNYQKIAGPTYVDQGSIAQIGRRVTTLNFEMVNTPNQAYRLAARFAKRINGKKKLQITLGPRGMLAVKQRVVAIDAPNFQISGTWRVESLQPDMTLTRWTATLREVTSSIFDNVVVPEDPVKSISLVKAAPGANTQNTVSTSLVAPQNFYYATFQSDATTGGFAVDFNYNYNTSTSAIPLIYTTALIKDETLDIEVQYATSADSGVTWSGWAIAPYYTTRYRVEGRGLPRGRKVKFRARRFALDGTTSSWSSEIIIAAAIP